jgi:hypothetical protein
MPRLLNLALNSPKSKMALLLKEAKRMNMLEIEELLNCAIGSLARSVWLGSCHKADRMFLISRADNVANNDEIRRLYLYCLCFSKPTTDCIASIKDISQVESLDRIVTIGRNDDSPEEALKEIGFRMEWTTTVYYKKLSRTNLTPLGSAASRADNLAQIVDISSDSIAAANSFCEDYRISMEAISDRSLVNWLLVSDNAPIGKLQLALCPPFGGFCTLVAIRDDHRRRGYFLQLMRAAEEYTMKQRLAGIALFGSQLANEICLYPKVGYAVCGQYQSFCKS